MRKPTKPIIITSGGFFLNRGYNKPPEPDVLWRKVEALSTRANADHVMTEAFQNCDVMRDVNEQIDEALRAEIKRLKMVKE